VEKHTPSINRQRLAAWKILALCVGAEAKVWLSGVACTFDKGWRLKEWQVRNKRYAYIV